jgi:hypothetical protein
MEYYAPREVADLFHELEGLLRGLLGLRARLLLLLFVVGRLPLHLKKKIHGYLKLTEVPLLL